MTRVVSSLAPIQTNGYSLRKLFFQLSLSDDSPASTAVLRAILSLASLYSQGYGEEPLRLKTAALESLGKSMNGRAIGTREIYQHVAVGMLICSFEVCRLPLYYHSCCQLYVLTVSDVFPIPKLIPMAIVLVRCQEHTAYYLSGRGCKACGGRPSSALASLS